MIVHLFIILCAPCNVQFIFFSRVLKLLTLLRGSAATSRIAATEREAVQPHGFGKASLKALLSRKKVLVLAVSFCQFYVFL